jgi:apolipoprotein N-acyltransferase
VISFRQFLVCAALSAILLWSAGQQCGLFALGWIALTPLLWALHSLSDKQRFWRGWLAGFFIYLLVNWWIAPTIARAAPMIGLSMIPGAMLGVIATVLVAAIHGFGVAFCALLWNAQRPVFQRNAWVLPLYFAAVWTLWDVLRTSGQLAHAWGALGYTQWRDIALLQNASWAGQHGLTFFCVWFAASIALWARVGQPVLWRAPLIVLLALHGVGALLLNAPQESHTSALRVLVVQTAVPSLRKNQRGRENDPLREALRLSYQNARRGEFDLIVWPETTVDAVGAEGERQVALVQRLAQEMNAHVLFGTREGATPYFYNVAALIEPASRGEFSYHPKRRLVPFGERAPYGDIFPFLKRFAPQPEVRSGDDMKYFNLRLNSPRLNARFQLGTVICFESCFPSPADRARITGAQAFFILTNDEWFAGSNAPWEHAAMASMRAVENGVWTVQSANGGYSFVVDRHGRFVVKSAFNKAQTLAVDVPLN